jgi:hypothetical protein
MNDGNGFIDNDTMNKIKKHEEMMKSAKTNPVVDRTEETEKMLNKCSNCIYEMEEHFNTKAYLTDKQLLMLKSISNVIDIRSGAIKVEPEIKPETDGEIESDKNLIKRCLAQNPASGFIKSVAEFYNKNGRVTDKQRLALIRNSAVYVPPVINTDIESVEYKDTQTFLLKCEEAFPDSNFVKSVKEQFVRNGRITDRQRQALMKTLKEAEDKIKNVVVDKIVIDDDVGEKEVVDEIKIDGE